MRAWCFYTNFIVTLKLEKLKNDERAAVRIKYDYVCKVLGTDSELKKCWFLLFKQLDHRLYY